MILYVELLITLSQVTFHNQLILLLVSTAYHQKVLWADEPQELLKPVK